MLGSESPLASKHCAQTIWAHIPEDVTCRDWSESPALWPKKAWDPLTLHEQSVPNFSFLFIQKDWHCRQVTPCAFLGIPSRECLGGHFQFGGMLERPTIPLFSSSFVVVACQCMFCWNDVNPFTPLPHTTTTSSPLGGSTYFQPPQQESHSLPSGNLTWLLKMTIYSGYSH